MDLYQQIFFTTIAFSFGILHLILFIYNSRFKGNLFFAIFLFLFALNIFFDYQASLLATRGEEIVYLRIHRGVMPSNSVFILLFTYYAFNLKIPKHFWLIVAGLAITGFFSVLEPIENFKYVQIALITVSIELIRVYALLLRNKKHDAWIIAIGFSLLFLFSMYDMLLDLNLIEPVNNITNGYPFGFLCLIFSASIYLARDFARANKIILTKEREAREMEIAQRLLEAENARKSKELEEARNLQLSMLPDCVTELNGIEICFDMKTATEVGGDYYDYNISEDGTLILTIGDATGHGMKAGIMVSVIKSLFLTHIPHMDIISFFNKCSQSIKQMRLGNLYMAMMLVKIKDRNLIASSAGMPPIFIYRKNKKLIEEFVIKGMPLGAFESFPYQTIETKLEPGDTVLLMSDGLPELFNEHDEILNYSKIKEIFNEVAESSPNEIVNHLFIAGDKWRNERNQNDDITFIVFKYS